MGKYWSKKLKPGDLIAFSKKKQKIVKFKTWDVVPPLGVWCTGGRFITEHDSFFAMWHQKPEEKFTDAKEWVKRQRAIQAECG